MGKATIVSGGVSGLYQIKVKYDNAKLDKQISKIQEEIDRLTFTVIPSLDAKHEAEKAKLQAAADKLNEEIGNYQPEGGGGGGSPPILMVASAVSDAAASASMRVGQKLNLEASATAAVFASLKYGIPMEASARATANSSATLS